MTNSVLGCFMVSDIGQYAGEKKANLSEEISFYIGANQFETQEEKTKFPSETYPVFISIDYGGKDFYHAMKSLLLSIGKDNLRFRHKDYYGTRFDIFLRDSDGVRRLLYDEQSPLKNTALYERFTMQDDSKIYPHMVMDRARGIIKQNQVGIF